ncbi:uncharacterized protein LOC143035893 [Oratosquilla oratoria]|uniref:uncharacterized protein LOC143035893 n=1 Tax=Oratosquilla oratoria TaxID=337810 RepID=UPI003F76B3C3
MEKEPSRRVQKGHFLKKEEEEENARRHGRRSQHLAEEQLDASWKDHKLSSSSLSSSSSSSLFSSSFLSSSSLFSSSSNTSSTYLSPFRTSSPLSFFLSLLSSWSFLLRRHSISPSSSSACLRPRNGLGLSARREPHLKPGLTQLVALGFMIGLASAKVQHEPGDPLPTFTEPIGNITEIKGRDIKFTCVVKNLGEYKVGWVKADTKAIQAIHHQVVTHNPRVAVTYRDRTTWNLHIRDVQEDDSGVYMCQVNTDPMIAEMGHLEVKVPPEIDDNLSSGETIVQENGKVSLVCKATGHPPPNVSWRREQGVKIDFGDKKKVTKHNGEHLVINKVQRSDMGPYLCIATNGVPPSVSKRIFLKVTFPPKMDAALNMIGSPLGKEVNIECRVESSPRCVSTWKVGPDEQFIISSPKYFIQEKYEGYYLTIMMLTIKNFSRADAIKYRCVCSNSLGNADATVKVYEIVQQKQTVNKGEDDSRINNYIPQGGAETSGKGDMTSFTEKQDGDLDITGSVIPTQQYPGAASGPMGGVGGFGGGPYGNEVTTKKKGSNSIERTEKKGRGLGIFGVSGASSPARSHRGFLWVSAVITLLEISVTL